MFESLRVNWLMPLTDIALEWESEEVAKHILLNAVNVDLDPLKLVEWVEMKSDEAIRRWAFAGLTAHATVKLNGGPKMDASTGKSIAYVNDWSWLHKYDVRPGFEKYGATAYFDEHQHLVQIYYPGEQMNVTKTMKEWEHAKWVYKCSGITGVTLKDHLVGLHFMASNFLAMAEAEHLSELNPIRRLVRPFTYGTVAINLGAIATLAVENGLFHRASALTWKSVVEGFKDSFSLNRFHGSVTSFLQKQNMYNDATGEDSSAIYPFGQDALTFEKVVVTFVKTYVDLYYKDDQSIFDDREVVAFWDGLRGNVRGSHIMELKGKKSLIAGLTSFIIHVTGYHNQAGNVADYLINPTYASPKIRKGRNIADVQATFQGLNIGLMTAMKAPRLLSDFTHLWFN